MTLILAPGLSFCDAPGGRIFLDLVQDRYFCLGPAADAAFSAMVGSGKPDDEQRARLAALEQAGILVDDPFGACPRPCRQPPLLASPLDEDDLVRPSAARVLGTVWAIRRAKLSLRWTSLATVCGRITALKERHAQDLRRGRPDELARIAAAVAASGRVVDTLDQCLPCSIAVMRQCLAANIAAQLSIGVKLHPFGAHAWVAADGIVLTDRLELVRPFTPLLII